MEEEEVVVVGRSGPQLFSMVSRDVTVLTGQGAPFARNHADLSLVFVVLAAQPPNAPARHPLKLQSGAAVNLRFKSASLHFPLETVTMTLVTSTLLQPDLFFRRLVPAAVTTRTECQNSS